MNASPEGGGGGHVISIHARCPGNPCIMQRINSDGLRTATLGKKLGLTLAVNVQWLRRLLEMTPQSWEPSPPSA